MIDQIFIAIFGTFAIFLINCKRESLRCWGSLFGFLSQPFWFHTLWLGKQWGGLTMTVFSAVFWFMGVWNEWMWPWLEDKWGLEFYATYDDLGLIGWRPGYRFVKHLGVWRRSAGVSTQKRELYVYAFNWQLHWVWRVVL